MGGVVAPPRPRDGDGTDELDRGAHELAECEDTRDNDGDTDTDFGFDAQCASKADPDEAPQCSSCRDDDGDGRTDFPMDGGCKSPSDIAEDSESFSEPCGLGAELGLVLPLLLRSWRRRRTIPAGAGRL